MTVTGVGSGEGSERHAERTVWVEEPRDRNEVTRPKVGRFMTRRESERNPRGSGPIMTTSEETEERRA